MGKASGLAALVLVLTALVPHHTMPIVQAQGAPPLPCNSQPTTTPMQGQYVGPWHSDGKYVFSVFNTSLQLDIIIDGTLNLTVASDGRVSGTATGKVDAPIHDYGRKDVSSGYGTISGQMTGILTPSGSLLLLSHPVIDMQWGTFVGGGYTVERFISMPDYHFSTTATDCVSAGGAIAEKDFPVQTIIADGAGQMTQAPGIGEATGTWQMTSNKAGTFRDLSRQVDEFITTANATLAGDALTLALVEQRVVLPLRALEAGIRRDPDVARCLLDRLAAWEASAVHVLYARAASTQPTNLAGFRATGDLLRATALLNSSCILSDGGTSDRLLSAETAALKATLTARDWSQSALLMREVLLLRGKPVQASVQQIVNDALHSRLGTISDSTALLESARIAYLFNDDIDASAAYKRLVTRSALRTYALPDRRKKKGKKPRAKPTPSARPKPTPTSTPMPTPRPQPKTLEQVLSSGIGHINGQTTGENAPTFSWQPVAGATRYLISVSEPHGTVVWTWSGGATTVTFGDTSIEGTRDTAVDGWSLSAPMSYTWTVIALDIGGRIIGVKLR